MQVIDADAHIEESVKTWEFIDPAFYARRPIPVEIPLDTSWGDCNAAWIIDDRIRRFGATPTLMQRAHKKDVEIPSQELTDVKARVRDLDRLGIQKQVIFPSLMLGCLAEDVDLEVQLARSYNTFLAQKCNESGGRLWYAAIIPFRRPDAAIDEIRRIKQMAGAASIFVRGMEWDTPINHPRFNLIYEEAERQQLPITVHIGQGSPSIVRMFDGMPRLPGHLHRLPPRGRGLVSFLLSQYAFQCIMEAGLLEEFPKLCWAFLELGSEWIVPAITSLSRSGKINCRKFFDDGRIFISCEPDEDLPHVISKIGEDSLMVASDFPHTDAFRHDYLQQVFGERGDLSAGIQEKILEKNAARLYGI
jgi:predicted TIM-barrel fold metal-dependent hydrolase